MSETDICNAALSKIGSKRINNISDGSVPANACLAHFEMTRDSLLRSHFWRFASARKVLSLSTVDPALGEWDNQYILPTDFLRLKSVYDETSVIDNTRRSFAIEGRRLLSNESTMKIRYIRKVTDTAEFDPLFVEVLILLLALKLIGSLAGGAPALRKVVQDELKAVMPGVLALDRQEAETKGRVDQFTWNDARIMRGGLVNFSFEAP